MFAEIKETGRKEGWEKEGDWEKGRKKSVAVF